MQIDPRHLVQFATIIEHRSFSAAAEALGTTQPALSRMVKDLELRLKIKLLAQRRRPVVPTSVGRDLAEQGFAIRAATIDASLIASDASEGNRGLLRIGAPPFICDFALARIITSYRDTHPGVSFDLTAAYSDDLRDRLFRNQLDLALGLANLESDKTRVESRHMINLAHAIVCRGEHPISRKRKISLPSLVDAEWISHSETSKLNDVMRDGLAAIGLKHIRCVVTSESAGAISTLVQSSDYLTVLPVLPILDELEAGKLMLMPIQLDYPAIPIVAMRNAVAPSDPLLAHFSDYLASCFAGLQEQSDQILQVGSKNRLRKGKFAE